MTHAVASRKETFRLKLPDNITILANRYTTASQPADSKGYTLILLHGTGAHKETWEPTIEHLFFGATSHSSPIYEIWSIEDPTHGESGVLNEDIFLGRVYDHCESTYADHLQ